MTIGVFRGRVDKKKLYEGQAFNIFADKIKVLEDIYNDIQNLTDSYHLNSRKEDFARNLIEANDCVEFVSNSKKCVCAIFSKNKKLYKKYSEHINNAWLMLRAFDKDEVEYIDRDSVNTTIIATKYMVDKAIKYYEEFILNNK